MLTPKQEAFAQGLADGMSQAAAYRQAYPKSQAWKDATVWRKASLAAANGDVQARVEAIRAELAERNLWSRTDSVRVLREVAESGEKGAERVAAVKELNAMHGFNAPQRLEHSLDASIAWPVPMPKDKGRHG